MPFVFYFCQSLFGIPLPRPYLLDLVMICFILLAPIPKLLHDTVGDLAFFPPFIRGYDLSAASIYDDYDMLCFIVGHLHSEIKQGTVTHI